MAHRETGDLNYRETRLARVGHVQVYCRHDERGRPFLIDAIDEDADQIRHIADRLQRRGYGVMRRRKPRAGRVFYTLKATWAGAGEAPENPLDDSRLIGMP